MPYYIAAVNNCHPNYASYLLNKETISIKLINTILKQLPVGKKEGFIRQKLYSRFYILVIKCIL